MTIFSGAFILNRFTLLVHHHVPLIRQKFSQAEQYKPKYVAMLVAVFISMCTSVIVIAFSNSIYEI